MRKKGLSINVFFSANKVMLLLVVIGLAAPCSSIRVRSQETAVPSNPKMSVREIREKEAELLQQMQADVDEGISDDDPKIRTLQEQYLQYLSEEKHKIDSSEVGVQKGTPTTYVQFPVFYATDRVRVADELKPEHRSVGLEYGKAFASASVDYRAKSLLISGARMRENGKEGASGGERFQSFDEMMQSMSASIPLTRTARPRLMLFVHGFANTFESAAVSTARLSAQMRIPLVPMFYSWPSAGKFLMYTADEDMIQASEITFTAFLEHLLQSSPFEIILVCHSMGSREVSFALGELARRGVDMKKLTHVVFAASDIYAAAFQTQWTSLQPLKGVQFGFYTADNDMALKLSWGFHLARPRLGSSGSSMYLPPGGMTVDASAIDSYTTGYGHSYIIDQGKIALDISKWIDRDADRGLSEKKEGSQTYFAFPPQQ